MSEVFHRPVLTEEVCSALAPTLATVDQPPAGTLVDATCGGGGHAAAMLSRSHPARAILVDRDREALAAAQERLRAHGTGVVEFVHGSFAALPETLAELGVARVEALLADLGVSSHQLDTAERGFSFRHDAPLDMRMDRGSGPSAAEVLAEISEPDLTRILRQYGEEPRARRIARAICAARPRRTAELAEVVSNAVGGRRQDPIHPATLTFQALRIHVNGELEALDDFLARAPELLAPGGRMGVISFHSLEDRRVKVRFAELSRPPRLPDRLPVRAAELPTPRFSIPEGYERGVVADAAETRENPRARSARLRVMERRP